MPTLEDLKRENPQLFAANMIKAAEYTQDQDDLLMYLHLISITLASIDAELSDLFSDSDIPGFESSLYTPQGLAKDIEGLQSLIAETPSLLVKAARHKFASSYHDELTSAIQYILPLYSHIKGFLTRTDLTNPQRSSITSIVQRTQRLNKIIDGYNRAIIRQGYSSNRQITVQFN